MLTTKGAHISSGTNSHILPQYVTMDKHIIFTVFIDIESTQCLKKAAVPMGESITLPYYLLKLMKQLQYFKYCGVQNDQVQV